MFIISHNEAFVKWSEKKTANVAVAHKMIEAGFRKRGYLMLDCGKFIETKYCPDCGKSFISSAMLCRDRLCPTCQWRLSIRRFAEMCNTLALIEDFDESTCAFWTVTVRNCRLSELKATISLMNQAWHRVLQRKTFKKHVSGWARSLEVTYNASRNDFHPHFHVIVMTDGALTEGEFYTALRREWKESLRISYEPVTEFHYFRADESRLDNDPFIKAILETYKYTMKSKDVLEMPISAFRAYVNGITGVRVASYGGKIKEARRALNYNDDDNEEEISRIQCDCGAELRVALLQWSFESGQYNLVKEAVRVQSPEVYQDAFDAVFT
jgi:plasmid rolling circle replication initiator protein Rep